MNGTLTVTGTHSSTRSSRGSTFEATRHGHEREPLRKHNHEPGASGIRFAGVGNGNSVFSLNEATIANNVITGSGGSGIRIAIQNLDQAGPVPTQAS